MEGYREAVRALSAAGEAAAVRFPAAAVLPAAAQATAGRVGLVVGSGGWTLPREDGRLLRKRPGKGRSRNSSTSLTSSSIISKSIGGSSCSSTSNQQRRNCQQQNRREEQEQQHVVEQQRYYQQWHRHQQQQHYVAIQDHVDRKFAAAAAAQVEAFVTHALVEANKERAQAQDKMPRSSDDSSHADPIVQGITKAFQGTQVQQQQQAAANSQAGAFSHGGFRPPVFDACFKQGEDIQQVERGMGEEMVLTSRQQQYDRQQHRRQLQTINATAATNAAFTAAASYNGRGEEGAGGGLAVVTAAAVKP